MNDVSLIAEATSQIDYTTILNSILIELEKTNMTLEVIENTSTFGMAIIAGCLVGAVSAYSSANS